VTKSCHVAVYNECKRYAVFRTMTICNSMQFFNCIILSVCVHNVFTLETPTLKKRAVLVGTAMSTSNVSLITLYVSGVGMLTLLAETPVIGVTKVRYIL
jgi:hypothetical protein